MTISSGNTASADEVIESMGRLESQNTNRILKSDTSVFVNEGYSGADDFTDSNGVMNTIDTGTTTGLYNFTSDFYALGFTDEASGDSTNDDDSFTNPENAFDGDDNTVATVSVGEGKTKTLGKTFSSKNVSIINGKVGFTAGGSRVVTIKLQTYNGSTWSDVSTLYSGTSSTQTISFINVLESDVQGVRISYFLFNAGGMTAQLYTLEYGDYDSSSAVETNTIVNDIIPKSIVVYGETDIPTDTSITVDVSDDGGSTWDLTGKSLDTAIDTSTFSTGNLALKFNLATTDTSATPKIYGYGVAITDA